MEKLLSLKYNMNSEKDIKYEDFRQLYFYMTSIKTRIAFKGRIFLIPFAALSLGSLDIKRVYSLSIRSWFFLWICFSTCAFLFSLLFATFLLVRYTKKIFAKSFLHDGEVELNIYEDEIGFMVNGIEIACVKYDKITGKMLETKNNIFVIEHFLIPKCKISQEDLNEFRNILRKKVDYVELN